MTSEQFDAWLRFYISGEESGSVDSRALAALLNSFSNAVLVSARTRLGLRPRRSGRPSAVERRLAAIRVRSISPGSLEVIYERPPPVIEYQTTFGAQIDPDDVAEDVIREVEDAREGKAVTPGFELRRDSVERLLRRAEEIGRRVDISHHSLSGERLSVTIELRDLHPPSEPERSTRSLTLFGHAYMADVELGRQRIRVKLPDESDVTMELDEELRDSAVTALDQAVRLVVDETIQDGAVIGRIVREMRLLKVGETGPDKPPKTLEELAREQGLLFEPVPDYIALASEVWPEDEDVDEFVRYLSELRAASR